ncbi:MAG: helix-turn-helix transcriptional regulator, partial [Rhodospirillaceae bacterium]|nr:helix-turn-helix transcriptional regulator [Rhodospirillaceae bacterium]
LVTRTVFPSVPPRVDYELTGLGRSLLNPVSALAAWAIDHRADIAAAQLKFDMKAEAAEIPEISRAPLQLPSSPRP